uniref:Uncharacterized protein n=1 Tax=Brassica oleracea var. oleracea TaxID=109376 RepID=A0A0D3BTI8_BRAOL
MRNFFDKYFFEMDSFLRKLCGGNTRPQTRAQKRSLRNDQTRVPLGRNVATELFRNVDTTLVHAFSSTLRCYLPKTVVNPFHVSRHSKSSIKLYGVKCVQALKCCCTCLGHDPELLVSNHTGSKAQELTGQSLGFGDLYSFSLARFLMRGTLQSSKLDLGSPKVKLEGER